MSWFLSLQKTFRYSEKVAFCQNNWLWPVEYTILGCNAKNDRMILLLGKPFNITVIQVCAPSMDAKVAEIDQFYEDLLALTHTYTHTHKRCSSHHWGLECKSRKSRDTWSNKQVWSCRTKWSRIKANWIPPRECTGHTKYPFQQHKRWLYTWTSPNGQYRSQIDYIFL